MGTIYLIILSGLIIYWKFRSYSLWKQETIFKHDLVLLYNDVKNSDLKSELHKEFLMRVIEKTHKEYYYLSLTGLFLSSIILKFSKRKIKNENTFEAIISADPESEPYFHRLNNSLMLYIIGQSFLGRLLFPIVLHFYKKYSALTKWGKSVLYKSVLCDDDSHIHFNGGFLHS